MNIFKSSLLGTLKGLKHALGPTGAASCSFTGMTFKRTASAGGVVKGLNILKNGSDPDEMRDEDVPDWLRDLGQNGAGLSLQELERKGELTDKEAKMLRKLKNRSSIKRANSLSAK